mmetsp:Transcript_8191/g.20444  ORF Transcript_8191/g.20444 Transcript_8191/m.20444 type:complete len:239 (-) Transcript_8191:127-843(-)
MRRALPRVLRRRAQLLPARTQRDRNPHAGTLLLRGALPGRGPLARGVQDQEYAGESLRRRRVRQKVPEEAAGPDRQPRDGRRGEYAPAQQGALRWEGCKNVHQRHRGPHSENPARRRNPQTPRRGGDPLQGRPPPLQRPAPDPRPNAETRHQPRRHHPRTPRPRGPFCGRRGDAGSGAGARGGGGAAAKDGAPRARDRGPPAGAEATASGGAGGAGAAGAGGGEGECRVGHRRGEGEA